MNPDALEIPQFSDIEKAAARIAMHAHRTPILRARTLNTLSGANLYFKCENLQRAGAFKFRGACNAVWSLPDAMLGQGVVTHSSGNHGAALTLAAKTRGMTAHIVVPQGTSKTKAAAIEAYGGTLQWCEPTMAARETAAAHVCNETGAYLVHPFADPFVVAGQGTAALELLREAGSFDALIAPIGGGGLVSGCAIAAAAFSPATRVYAVEPEGAAEAHLSLQKNQRITDHTPNTICDGLRGTIGAINFEILRHYGVSVLTVSDTETIAAMRLIWERLKLIVEPSSATVLAAVLRYQEQFANQRIGLILSGGNIDLDALPW